MYLWRQKSPASLGRLGDDEPVAPTITADPSTLFVGLAALAGAFFLLGGNVTPKIRRAEASRLKRRRDTISKRISALES